MFQRFSTLVLSLALAGTVAATAPRAPMAQSGDVLPFVEVAKLIGNPEDGSAFGEAVAADGDTVVVGTGFEFGGAAQSGAAYVFQRDQGGPNAWGLVKRLTAGVETSFAHFGESVAISGDLILVGARGDNATSVLGSGAAYVFNRNQGGSNNWGQVAKLEAGDPGALDWFGAAVAIDGGVAIVGAERDASRAGSAYVFGQNQGGAGNWGQVKKLTASDAAQNDGFGSSVGISGETVVIGAPGDDHPLENNAGSAHVFQRNSGGAGNWGAVKKLLGADFEGGDLFGESAAIDGDTIFVGAPSNDNAAGLQAGTVHVFGRDHGGADNWGQSQQLFHPNAVQNDRFGQEVSIDGDLAVVGARLDDDGAIDAGAVHVLERTTIQQPASWEFIDKLTASDADQSALFGFAASISGRTVVVGALETEVDGNGSAGAAYVFGESACETLLDSASAVPNGFGAPFDVFAPDDLLLAATCGNDVARLEVGKGDPDQIIYRYGYELVNGQWQRLDLTGNVLLGGLWWRGSASADRPWTATQQGQTNVFLAYVCTSTGSEWKCGCRDATCAQSFWQVQGYEVPAGDGSGALASGR